MKKRTPHFHFIRRITAAFMAAFMIPALLSGCQTGTEEKEVSRDVRVETRTIEAGVLEIRSQYIGTVSPNITIDVVPFVSGKVEEVKVKVGDKVKAGDLLCRLDDTAADLSLKAAEDAVNSAEAGKEAAKDQIVSARIQANSSVKTLENALKGYRDSLKTAKDQLDKLKKSRKSMIKAQNMAKQSYGDAAKRYKTAQNILVQFEAFLNQNPDCKTTAGLMIAASAVSPDPSDYTALADVPEIPSETSAAADEPKNPSAANDPSAGDVNGDANTAADNPGDANTGENSTGNNAGSDPSAAATSPVGNESSPAGGSGSESPSSPAGLNPGSQYPSADSGSGNSSGYAAPKVDKQKQKTAQALQKVLADNGLTVEYISTTGVGSLKENADDGKNAYANAATGLTQLDASIGTMKTNIDQLKAQIKSSKDSLVTARKLAEAADAGTDVYDAQIAAAQTGVDSARYQKDMYRLTAPIDGVVDAVNVKEKGNAAQGYAAFTISEKESMIATFYVTEEVKNFLRPGHEVVLEEEDSKNRPPVTGTITMIGTSTDPQKGLFKVEAEIFTTGQKKLSGGVNVKLSVVSNAVEDQLLVPYDAVYYENGQAYVYVYSDGKAHRRDVETGLFNEDKIAVIQGLNAGDAVITTWASGLKDGARVEISNGEDSQ